MSGRVVNPSTVHQVWRSYGYPFLSWVLTYPIGYHWQCLCSHCACAVSRDHLCVWGIFSYIFEIPETLTPICLYTIQLYGTTMTFKGRLLLAPLMLKLFSAENYEKYCLNRAPKWRFGEKGGVDVNFCFCDLQKAHPCAEPRILSYFALMSVVASWL